MLKIKPISDTEYQSFTKNQTDNNMYQSIEWVKSKNNKYEILGLFNDNKMVGASIVTYIRALRKFYVAYASRGFIYDYSDIPGFAFAVKEYMNSKKNVIFFRMDPLIKLNTYDPHLVKTDYHQEKIIEDFIKVGFKHYGFNIDYTTWQFRFVHVLELCKSFNEQFNLMSKSTKKNIEKAISFGVKTKRVDIQELDQVYKLFEESAKIKKIHNLTKSFYHNLALNFNENAFMYLAYIDKKECINNLTDKINAETKDKRQLEKQLKDNSNSLKIKSKINIYEQNIEKYMSIIKEVEKLDDYTNIGSLFAILYGNEMIALSSGMDYKYRSFCPKYSMYPALIKDAIKNGIKYANFLGVKNIFDKNDEAYGVYDIKKGFGGYTVEYIGEFDLPIKKLGYKLYKAKENKERKK